MKSLSKISIISFAIALLLGSYWFSMRPKAKAQPVHVSAEETMNLGTKLYQEKCAACHGVNLEGQANWRNRAPNGRLPAPPHDKTGHTWHHNDTLLFNITKFGTKAIAGGNYETDMRGYKDEMSDAEIVAVLTFIKSTWPIEIQKRRNRMNKSN